MIRRAGVTALLAIASATPLHAQASGSQANLVFGVAASYTGRSNLWAVPDQGVPYVLGTPPGAPDDVLSVARDVAGGLGLMFYGMYFPSATVGLSGEIYFLGTQYEDHCSPVSVSTPTVPDEGPNLNPIACSNINGATQSTATVLATVGGIARAWPRGAISPYVRLGGGLGIISRTSVDMVSNIGETLVRIYDTNDKSALTLAAIAGVGFTARAANGGYQIRIEGRDNIVGYRGVTGATPAGIVTPDTKVRYQHLLSLVLGFEIVLERSRGRRY